MRRPSTLRNRLATLGLALILAACDNQATPRPTSGPAASGSAQGTQNPAATQNDQSQGPLVTPGPGDPSISAPLPLPSLTDAGQIGQELYNPANVSTAVVSLLALMGVEIVTDDGAVVRPGADRGAGRISLTENQVIGLIDMTRDDLKNTTDAGTGPITVAQLFEGLRQTFPAGYTVDAFATAYDSAYATDSTSLVSKVMIGMPITPSTRLMRVQMWLLLVDGFPDAEGIAVGASPVAFARFTLPDGARRSALLGGGRLGAAALNLPRSTSPVPGWTDGQWHNLLRLLPTLAFRIPLTASGMTNVHEGHGRLGDRWQLSVSIGPGLDIGSARTGVALLSGTSVAAGLPIVWNSTRPGILSDHGQVREPLNALALTDASGSVRNGYQAKREDSNGRGTLVDVVGNLYAEVKQLDLVRAAYRIPGQLDAILECRCLITGVRRTPHPDFEIAWHEEDVLEITIEDYYNYVVPLPLSLPDELFSLKRKGKDTAKGTLALNKDGTYSGILHATSSGTAEGEALLGLAGIAECGTPDVSSGNQDLYVIGEKVGQVSLLLRFYPASTPLGTFTNCQAVIDYPGDGVLGLGAGKYLPLNDTRWQNPDVGIEIPIPGSAGEIIDQYEDKYLYQPDAKLCSVYYITVIWPDPKASANPTAGPPRQSHLCT